MMSNAPYQVTTIDLLRHGKPEGGEIFRGATDVDLSPEGFEQMRQAVIKLTPPDLLITSPLKRCADFARELGQNYDKPVQQESLWRELSFGDWDGQSFQDIKAQYREQFDQYWQDPIHHAPPNAEPMSQFSRRIQRAYEKLLLEHQGKHVLVVTHGGVIRAMIACILQSELTSLMRYEVPYACVSQIKVYHEGDQCFPQMVFHNR